MGNRKQTRRSISVKGTTYIALSAYVETLKETGSKTTRSGIVERWILEKLHEVGVPVPPKPEPEPEPEPEPKPILQPEPEPRLELDDEVEDDFASGIKML